MVGGYGGSKALPKLCNDGGGWAKLDICKGAKGILWSIEECTTFLQRIL